MFAIVHSWIASGHVAVTEVEVGEEPHPDRERRANAKALASLPEPFTASVNPGHDGDGEVAWPEPIRVAAALPDLVERRHADGRVTTRSLHYMLPSGWAPLEIGSTLPSRTWLHLVTYRRTVARWPYGHHSLYVFQCL